MDTDSKPKRTSKPPSRSRSRSQSQSQSRSRSRSAPPSAKKETRNIKLRTKRDSIHFTADVDFIVQFKEPLIHAS